MRDADYGGPLPGIWFGTYPIEVNPDHPASDGLADFEIEDETYSLPDCDDECDVLLTTTNERSMRTIAWSRTHGDSRVFCTEMGHDPRSWRNPAFRTLVQNGLRWCADSPASESETPAEPVDAGMVFGGAPAPIAVSVDTACPETG